MTAKEESFRKDGLDLYNFKKDFPIFSLPEHRSSTFIYLDSAATSLKPKSVIDKMSDFYLYRYGTVHRAVYNLAARATEEYSNVREKLRQFLHARYAEEIIFTSGTTDSINLVARSFGGAFFQEGDEVIISAAEHHANIVPWQMLALEKKITLKVVSVLADGSLDLEMLDDLLTEKTRLVSMAYMTNTTGAIYPVKEIVALAHKYGAKVLIDAAQAVGHMRIDVQELDVDFLAFSAHKMYGPTGVGVLYGKKALLTKMPPHKGGGDMIEKVTFAKTTYEKPPLRFEAGTPMIAEVIGMGAAIDYILGIGLATIEHIEQELYQYARKKCKELADVSIIGDSSHKGPLITFSVADFHPLDVGTLLSLKGVSVRTGKMCAEPLLDRFGYTSALRISLGIYNTKEEIDRFIALLQEAMVMLKPELSY